MFLLLCYVTLALLVYLLYQGTQKPKGFPPGPFRLPFFGFLPWLNSHLPHKQFWRLSAKHGGVAGVYFGTQPTVLVSGWEAVKESLANEDLNDRPESLAIRLRGKGKILGVMFTNGEFWKFQRRFSLHHLRNLGFGRHSHEAVVIEEAEDLINEINNTKGGVSLQTLVGVSSINILWAVLGGKRFPRDNPELHRLVDEVNLAFRAGEVSGGLVEVIPFLRHFLPATADFHVLMNASYLVSNFIERSVAEHKKTFNGDDLRDFIDIYLNELNNPTKDPSFTEEQMVGLCFDVFFAGAETGSSFVSFAVLMSLVNPGVQERIQAELDKVVGRDRYPSMEDKTKLVYTEAVINEVFRFRAPAPLTVPHFASKDTTIKGYHIPANTIVINNLYSILMDPEYWVDPEVFRPERFIQPDGSLKKEERLIPFGKGKRICLGESLARMTGFLMFTSLMQRCSFRLASAVPDTEGKAGFTLGPPKYEVLVTKRY